MIDSATFGERYLNFQTGCTHEVLHCAVPVMAVQRGDVVQATASGSQATRAHELMYNFPRLLRTRCSGATKVLKIIVACLLLFVTSNMVAIAEPTRGSNNKQPLPVPVAEPISDHNAKQALLVAVAEPTRDHNKKQPLLVAVADAPPFSMKNEDGQWTGFSIDLWKEIARGLNLEYRFQETDLDKLVKGIEDKTFDAAATGIYVTSPRETAFDFSAPFFASNITIAVNSDDTPSIWFVLRAALTSWNFLGLMLLIVVLAILGGCVLWCLEQREKAEHYGHKDGKSFGRAFLWSVMVLAGGEFPRATGWETVAPKSLLARLFAMFWVVFGVMTISLFTASAASVLTSRQMRPLINTPNDLKHVRVGTVTGSTDHGILQGMHIKHVLYDDPVQLVRALAEKKIDAAVYGEPILRYYAKNMFSNKITVLRFSLHRYFIAFPMTAGSEWRKPISVSLLKHIESKEWQATLAEYLGTQ